MTRQMRPGVERTRSAADGAADTERIIRIQANEHPLVLTDQFESLEQLCLHLMHCYSYEIIADAARAKAVLDLGCNVGYGTDLLHRVAASVVGVDVSQHALADAKRRYPHLDLRIYDGVALPFEDHSFDVVCSLQVVEHIPEPLLYLTEIFRVMRPGGVAYLTTPNAAIRLDPGMQPWNRFHVREYRAGELRAELRAVFRDVEIRGLFARPELYQVEFQRCQRALLQARQRRRGLLSNIASRIGNAVRRKLGAGLGGRGKQKGGRAEPGKLVTLPAQDKYSTADFYYRDVGLDEALDLMAICRKT